MQNRWRYFGYCHKINHWNYFQHWLAKAGSKRRLLHHSSSCHSSAGSWRCSTPSLKWSWQPAQVNQASANFITQNHKNMFWQFPVEDFKWLRIPEDVSITFPIYWPVLNPQGDGKEILSFSESSLKNISVKNSHFFLPSLFAMNFDWFLASQVL